MTRKLPIGIQGFEGLRKDGYVYVDKTEYVYRLVHEGKPYFLSRPRRFGKSLLLSTMKAYWEGKKELFTGLAIEKLEENNPDAWKAHPVFYFDFNGTNYQKKTALEDIIDEQLRRWEKDYNIIVKDKSSLGERFRDLLIRKVREDRFDIRKFTNRTIFAGESTLKDYTGDSLDPIPLLYQTGYLTISDYDAKRKRYTLSFPNEEVRYGFLESLMPSYVPKATAGNGLDIFTFDEAVENGN